MAVCTWVNPRLLSSLCSILSQTSGWR